MNCCSRKIEALTVAVVAPNLLITVPNQTFVNQAVYSLGLCNALPEMTGIEPVYIISGALVYPLLDNSGNILRAGRLRGKRKYRLIYGSDPMHFLVLDGLCAMKYSARPSLMNLATVANTAPVTTKEKEK